MSTAVNDRGRKMPKVAIVILNWNGWKDTEECLQSLIAVNYDNYDIIVVDNGSTDDSSQMLKADMQRIANGNKICSFVEISMDEAARCSRQSVPSLCWMVLITCGENYGFAKGNNIGIKYAFKNLNPDYILLLNSDTIVEKEFLRELVSVANSNLSVGSVQSLLLRPGGKIIDSLGQRLYPLAARDYKSGTFFYPDHLKDDMEIFGSCAAAALYRSEALVATGLLDEDFYIILEDVDLSFRMRLAGYTSMLSTKSLVYHKRGISGGRRPGNSLRQIGMYHSYKNWVLLTLRYYSAWDILFSQKFYRSLGGWILYSLRIGKASEFSGLIMNSLKIRHAVTKNSCINGIRAKWINRGKPVNG